MPAKEDSGHYKDTRANATPMVAALKDTLPLAVSAFMYGTVFGMTARRAGLTIQETLLMSGIVFAGAAQFTAVSMWAAGASTLEILATSLAVNLRHLLMGASLGCHFRGRLRGLESAVLAAGLSDESYVISARYFSIHGVSSRYLLTSNALLYVSWLLSTLVGARFPEPG